MEQVVDAKQLVAWLAPTVGDDKARDAVETASRRLGLPAIWSAGDARRVVAELQTSGGLVSIAARLVSRQLEAVAPVRAEVERKEVELDTLAALFARAVGDDKARDLVKAASRSAGIPLPCSNDEAHRLLDAIAAQPGIVGVTARFAKARFVLR